MMRAICFVLAVVLGLSNKLASGQKSGAAPCFVQPSSSTAKIIIASPRGRGVAIAPLSMAASNRKYSKRTTRIPRHHEEAAGISTGFGFIRGIQQRYRNRKRKILKEKWNSIRVKISGKRRKRLASRFNQQMSSSQGGTDSAIDDDDDVFGGSTEADEDDKDDCFTSLDAMRARAGVLRTRIRLRQESLSALERLMRDVKYELKRAGFQDAFDANAGYTKRTTNNFMYGQTTGETVSKDGAAADTDDVMNEFELAAINQKWKEQQSSGTYDQAVKAREEVIDVKDSDDLMEEHQLDLMEQRSLKLQNSILLDRIRLQRLESRIVCFESDELGIIERAVGNTLESLNEMSLESNPVMVVQRQSKKFVNTFGESTSVLLRKLDRVSTQSGRKNRDYASVTEFVVTEASAGVRIVGSLLSNPSQLSQLVDPDTPTLVPHVPAILARLDRLESHVAPILSQVLNNKRHLRSIEPYLDEILERFDDIEPHLSWILDHIDTLAPYTGLLLKHIDELLLYAEVDEYEAGESGKDNNYAFAEQLLPYLEVYVSQLDLVGPHLPLLRPHLPLLLKHNRIKILSPHVGKLFNKGYKDLSGEYFLCPCFVLPICT